MLKEKLSKIVNAKYFHVFIVGFIILAMLIGVGLITLKYNAEGETNMPFELTKISVISSSEGEDKEVEGSKWAFDLYQTNDVYLYIDKNKYYGKTEAIKSVLIDNIQIEAKNKENIKIYKPDNKEENVIFKNTEENEIKELEFFGDIESNIKTLKISNQGGLVAFRCSNNNLVEYISNDEEIIHNQLLKKANVTIEDIKIKLIFDLSIDLEDGKKYKTTIQLDLPIGNVIDDGITSTEITDLDEYIFKRAKN